ncbi:1,2-dihydroxy-3-keto-5-methylthiopentene dioxygenase-like isoform X2 [Limulus polyphemus]|uniref:Acireductone dioxygenase n=1 Tax=Limulus polyphemus TaxID=6850 RepID=A0ABM1BWE3_LIMPO|nr:1,2-dihydroxy-3-keto-5-methylthiopentene dioxygenase-like isoform X2 [Limulus polyphemus]
MVNAWYMDDSNADQKLEHHLNPPQFISIKELYENCGVIYYQLDADNYDAEGKLEKIKKDKGYNYEDEIQLSRNKLPDYEEKLKIFYKEHLHSDEEVRFFLDGSGYFDVRDKNDKWVRIQSEKGDLLVLPAGIYHRFTLDTNILNMEEKKRN